MSGFESVECYGVGGNERVWAYYEKNRESVDRIMRFDVLRMQWWLPRWILQLPYDVANRLNRRRLHSKNRSLRSLSAWRTTNCKRSMTGVSTYFT